jgi:hypothetical protein
VGGWRKISMILVACQLFNLATVVVASCNFFQVKE